MGNTNQAEADRTPTQEDEVNSVTTADDYEAFADQIAMGRGEAAKFAAEDKALSDEDEERFDDPDEEKVVDPDAEGEDEAEADEQSDDAGHDDDADDEEDGEGDDSADDSDDADADDADSDDDGEDADNDAKGDDDDDGDDDAAENDAGAKRYRVRASDKIEARALELKKRNRDMTLAECLERAERELNPNAGKNGEGGDDGDAQGAKVETPESLEADIERLSGEAEKAFTDDLDFDRGRELQKEIIALSKKLSKVRAEDAGADTLRQAESARQSAADAERKAVDLYDFVTDPKHPGVKLMEEIDQRLKDEGDPLFNDPAKALAIARMAARELGIAPRGKRRAEVVVKHPGKAPKKNSPVSIAGGNARTQAKSNEGETEAEIEKVNSVDDYEALIYGT